MKILTILAAGAAIALAFPAFAQGHDTAHGNMMKNAAGAPITIEAPWARASIGKNGAAYATLTNNGNRPDRLVAIKSPVAARVEIHTHIKEGDIMRMRQVKGGIAVAPGKSVAMKPGSYHIMLMGLNSKLESGGKFPVTFVFEKAGEINAMVDIGKAGAMGPAGGMGPAGMPSMPGGHSGGHQGGQKH